MERRNRFVVVEVIVLPLRVDGVRRELWMVAEITNRGRVSTVKGRRGTVSKSWRGELVIEATIRRMIHLRIWERKNSWSKDYKRAFKSLNSSSS